MLVNFNASTRLRHALVKWALCLGGVMIFVWISVMFRSGHLLFTSAVLYLACGFYLNRTVMRQWVQWHSMHNTLGEVAMDKLTYFLAWPLTYPMLFAVLIVNRVL